MPASRLGQKMDTQAGVAHQPDLLDRFTDLVLGANEPHRLAESAIGIVLTLTGARCAAVFRLDEGRLSLFASQGLDQHALDYAAADWAAAGAVLRKGEFVHNAAVSPDGPRSRSLAPIRSPDGLAGLLYLDSGDVEFLDPVDCARLLKFAAIFARALDAPPAPPGEAPRGWQRDPGGAAVDGGDRERLLALLEGNEWNIARVARILQVTRRTIYLRLARYGLPRERVRKGPVSADQ
jgi:regulatory Fis family protein